MDCGCVNNIRICRDLSLPGSYRHIVVKPRDVSWKLHRYDDPNLPLVLSDWDMMYGETLPEPSQGITSLNAVHEFKFNILGQTLIHIIWTKRLIS